MPEYLPSVGMEVHAELNTKSKMFCRCAVAFGGEANTRTCPTCLGLPGALPVPNQAAIEMVLKTALALNCTIAMSSIFHRKNYFYPDLAKGYQISQYGETNPLGYNGYLEVPSASGGIKRVRIRRVHLEEDTGKLMHLPSGGSGVDYNRSGVPLMEIVTDFPPDITNPEEAKEYLVQLRQLLLYLGVCDGKMEEGSLRCEPNISVRPDGSDEFGTKTELKNLNSFRSVQQGVQYEVKRQVAVIEKGEIVHQETRGWNEQKEASYLMRVKESENDYRYFPCPDLVPMVFEEAYIENLRKNLPELPLAKMSRYQRDFGLSDYDANWLVSDIANAEYFEEAVGDGGEPKAIFNWMSSDFSAKCNAEGITFRQSKIGPAQLVELTKLIEDGTVNSKMAKGVFQDMFTTGISSKDSVAESGMTQITDESRIQEYCRAAIREEGPIVEKYKAGQTNVIGFLVGQVMKASLGRANPEAVQSILRALLDE
jgi:aspartyl-tRNA(Asn)/glutamyl-tRNA(Gln) amidotransferase subunit B